MNIKYSANLQPGGESYNLIQQATKRLEEIVGPSARRMEAVRGPSAGLVSCEWDRMADKSGRDLYRLTLKDASTHVRTEFTLEDLKNPLHMHVRLCRLWGDLLQLWSDEQHKIVLTMLSQISDNEGD